MQNPLIQNYLQTLENGGFRPATIKSYSSDIQMFTAWFEQTNGIRFDPLSVTPTDLREYRTTMLAVKGYKASTTNRKLAALSSFFAWAHQTGMISADPTTNISWVAEEELAPRYLTRKEQYALNRALERELQYALLHYPKRSLSFQRDVSLIRFLLGTGLRVSAAAGLRDEDIQLSSRKGSVRVVAKGEKERWIPLNSDVRKALTDWLAVRPADSDFIWPALKGLSDKHLSVRAVQQIVKRYGVKAAAHLCQEPDRTARR
jgi:integrase/recombinase XerD